MEMSCLGSVRLTAGTYLVVSSSQELGEVLREAVLPVVLLVVILLEVTELLVVGRPKLPVKMLLRVPEVQMMTSQ